MLINFIEKGTKIPSSSSRWLDIIEESYEEDYESDFESDFDASSSTEGSVDEHLAFLDSICGLEDYSEDQTKGQTSEKASKSERVDAQK